MTRDEPVIDRLRRVEVTMPGSPTVARDLLGSLLRGSVKVDHWPDGLVCSVIDGRVVAELSPELAAQLALVLGAEADLLTASRGGDPGSTGIGRIADAFGRAAALATHPSRTGEVPQ